MQKENALPIEKSNLGLSLIRIVLGSLFLTALSQVSIPVGPVPITLQTLGVLLLGITLGSKEAFFSVLLYLGEATLGLPVLAGWHANPLWFASPRSGFLFGFLISAILAGQAKDTWVSAITWLSLAVLATLTIGTSVLAFFIGVKQAFIVGFAPFIIGETLKVGLAAASLKIKKFF